MTLAGLAGGLVLALNLDSRVIDVGYAGVVEQPDFRWHHPLRQHASRCWHRGHLRTLELPPLRAFCASLWFLRKWDFLPAAHALTACAFVGGAVAMFITGLRLSGRSSSSAHVGLGSFPYTLYSANNNTNDLVVAAISAIASCSASRLRQRGYYSGRFCRRSTPSSSLLCG